MLDTEALLIAHLDQLAGVTARGELPVSPTYPILTITRIGGVGPEPRWLDRATVQVMSWADTKSTARQTAATALQSLLAMGGRYTYGTVDGVVTVVKAVSGLSWVPDENGRPRYMFSVAAFTHPNK